MGRNACLSSFRVILEASALWALQQAVSNASCFHCTALSAGLQLQSFLSKKFPGSPANPRSPGRHLVGLKPSVI